MKTAAKLIILVTIALLSCAWRCQTYYEPDLIYSACVINKSSDTITTIKFEGYITGNHMIQNQDTWQVSDDQFKDGFFVLLPEFRLDNIKWKFVDVYNAVIIDTILPWKVVDVGHEVQYVLTLQADTTLSIEHIIKPL